MQKINKKLSAVELRGLAILGALAINREDIAVQLMRDEIKKVLWK